MIQSKPVTFFWAGGGIQITKVDNYNFDVLATARSFLFDSCQLKVPLSMSKNSAGDREVMMSFAKLVSVPNYVVRLGKVFNQNNLL